MPDSPKHPCPECGTEMVSFSTSWDGRGKMIEHGPYRCPLDRTDCRIRSLESALAAAEKEKWEEFEETTKERQQLEGQVRGLQSQLTASQAANVQLRAELEAEKNSHSRNVAVLSNSLEAAQSDLAAQKATNAAQEAKLTESEAKLSDQAERVAELERGVVDVINFLGRHQEDLMARGLGDERIFGMDEWSTNVTNCKYWAERLARLVAARDEQKPQIEHHLDFNEAAQHLLDVHSKLDEPASGQATERPQAEQEGGE